MFCSKIFNFSALTINSELSDIYCMRSVHETNICENCGYFPITNSHIKLRNNNFKCIYGINENKDFFYILNGPNLGYLGYGNYLKLKKKNNEFNLLAINPYCKLTDGERDLSLINPFPSYVFTGGSAKTATSFKFTCKSCYSPQTPAGKKYDLISAAYDKKNYCVSSCYEVPFSIYNDNLSQCSSKKKKNITKIKKTKRKIFKLSNF